MNLRRKGKNPKRKTASAGRETTRPLGLRLPPRLLNVLLHKKQRCIELPSPSRKTPVGRVRLIPLVDDLTHILIEAGKNKLH
jgi:hypothetical protein